MTIKKNMKKSLLIALFLFPLGTLYPAPDGIAGPLIGAVQSDRVSLWMFAPAEAECKFTYHSDSPDSPKSGKRANYCSLQSGCRRTGTPIQIRYPRVVAEHALPFRNHRQWKERPGLGRILQDGPGSGKARGL